MKRLISIFAVCLVCVPAIAAAPASRSRRTMSNQIMSAPRATASTNQISATAASVSQNPEVAKSSVRADMMPRQEVVDSRQREKEACINNNIGIGNTFVWASRYSNINNYASMVEDVENPENNTCFVKVEVKSSDARIDTSYILPQYYEMGRNITCGAWTNADDLRQKILDAKKSARAWATVGGVVGGAGIGVGAMELFGNELIGGKVEGQNDKKLSAAAVLRSQVLVLAKESPTEYKQFMRHVKTIRDECAKDVWQGAELPAECTAYDYEFLLSLDSGM